MLFRCCFHLLEENSIIYKQDIQPFYIGPILLSKNKIIQSVVGGKVDGQILFDARSEKPTILFGARGEKRKNLFGAKLHLRKFLFGSQRVKLIPKSAGVHLYCIIIVGSQCKVFFKIY